MPNSRWSHGPARPVVDLVLSPPREDTYGELVRFGRVLPWRSGEPPRYQDALLAG